MINTSQHGQSASSVISLIQEQSDPILLSFLTETDQNLVMAEQSARDVVKEAQSMGSSMPIDDIAKPTNTTTADDNGPKSPNSAICVTKEAAEIDRQAVSCLLEHESRPVNDGTTLQTTFSDNDDQKPAANQSDIVIPNGTGSEQLTTEEAQQQNAAAEASGGSDTDTRGHVRTGSVKKPTFFKTSSVTKNFLAKTASSTPPVPGSKAASVPSQGVSPTQAIAKPRLVAKSGSGIGNIPRSGLAKPNGASGGPDASKVWNKNQPIPPPPPKQFTDEELKQQYGIHMATRLQADDPSKDQSKWADIDDDEDDWVPETVEWMDGTKSAVAATDNAAPPLEQLRPPVKKQEPPVETAEPVQPIQPALPVQPAQPAQPAQEPSVASAAPPVQRPTSTGGAKTILKPGIAVQNTQFRPGVVLKGVPEKTGLVAKPAAPTPPKSPWASLPPVERVPPVQINPPVQQPSQSRFAQRDSHGFDALPPMPPPAAKEIAADDFSRNWREERGTKELFNSQSGRYEPVNDARRGSFRDSSHRQPSVLQRPNHGPGAGHAEPSAAFQTSRSGPDAGPWTRRRTSSNVSGGSGSRRMSFGRPQDGHPFAVELPPPREVPPAAGIDNTGSIESHRASIHLQQKQSNESGAATQQTWAQRPSPAASHAQPMSPFGSVDSSVPAESLSASTPGPDPVIVQQQVMKDNIERAREAKRRRDEEEAKAEAAKKERIQKLMARLEEKKSSDSAAVNALPSPPKPPVPTTDGEVTQYGMIKVHSSHTVKRASPPIHTTAPGPGSAIVTDGRDAAVHRPSVRGNNNSVPAPSPGVTSTTNSASVSASASVSSPHREQVNNSPSANNVISEAGPNHTQKPDSQPPRSTHISPSAPQDQSWKPPQPAPDAFQPWGSNLQSQSLSSSSVWGPPPSKDKPLGNGTFDTSYGRASSHQNNAQGSQVGPGPIAPPTKISPGPSQTVPQHAHSQDQQRGFAVPDIRLPPVAPIGAASPNQGYSQTSQPGPIAPPTRNMPGMQQPLYTVGDWTSLAGNPAAHDTGLIAKRNAVVHQATGGPRRIEETFRRTAPGSTVGERRVVQTEQYLHDNNNKTVVERDQAQDRTESLVQQSSGPPQVNMPLVGGHNSVHMGPTVQNQMNKPSRFFPQGPRNLQQSSAVPNGLIPGVDTDSPPPPDTVSTGHPVFDSDPSHPKVNLPTPKAIVKLPPAVSSPQPSVVMPVRPQGPARLGSQPIASSEAWQDRFNGLFGRVGRNPPQLKPASPDPPAAVVSSSSKTTFDVTPQQLSATVSLPSKDTSEKASPHAIFALDSSTSPTTRVSASEALMEEREFGSLPPVHFGKPEYENSAKSDFPLNWNPQNSRTGRVEPTSMPMLPFYDERIRGEVVLHVAIPNSKRGATTKVMPRNYNCDNGKPRKGSGYQGTKPKRNSARGDNANSTNSNPTARKPSNHHHPHQGGPIGATRPVTRWNSDGNNSSRSASSSWTKRPAPAAVH
ncbi:hypothetical protein EJ05DRAFT_489076 [Pseudovirgaria hyperparasitica]|uniref:Uncharacterized protein n=1 Tax=Pseudovirgaria hyperparasitica TaxID=470096 RepID=A0A6A6VWW8_9PEZI|nr:uncharacterized protein EJ05DRAFT_489076 [Pseudovirgaria hyperparasitica]KAF2754349.1 hypothetical protein EJ05DRAFT_489076 [Pseudovirgaria hyperparasitica]